MTKSKTIAAAIATLTLAATFTAIGGQAQAHPHLGHGWGIGAGFVAGTLIGAAAASNAYYAGYTECRYVDRYRPLGQHAHREGLRRRPLLSPFIRYGRRRPPSTRASIAKTRPASPRPGGSFSAAASPVKSTAANWGRARPTARSCACRKQARPESVARLPNSDRSRRRRDA